MDNYIVSARKYRPTTFSSVVGQKALTSTLRNAIATDRLAHAYLFCGSRGVGKTSCARIFAKTINCEHPTPDGDPCNECDSCRAFNAGSSLNIIELDAASNNGVDDMRNLVDQVQVPPTNGRYRVFIIDEVHMLSQQAFNAFLKTLEEPPSYVVFILATTEKHKIIPTILSRCQIYDFNRITISDMVDHLEHVAKSEGIEAERSALGVIATKADGAMRDALSIFDQVAASSRGHITYRSAVDNLNVLDAAYYSRLVEAFVKEDVAGALLVYKEIRDRGFDSHFFINGLAGYMRDLMVARDETTRHLVDTDEATMELMVKQADLPPAFFYKAMSLCNDADLHYRQATSKTFLVELLLIKLCQLLSPSPIFSGDGEGQLKPLHSSPATSSGTTAVPATPQQPQPQSTGQPTPQPSPRPAPQAPAAQPRPAPQAPAPPPAGAPRRVMPGAPRTMSIRSRTASDTSTSTTAETATSAPMVPSRTAPYTQEALMGAWNSFMAAQTGQHILINTMRACPPVAADPASPHRYIITVENPTQSELLAEWMPRLLTHVRDTLSNDMVTMELAINQGKSSPSTWNEREIVEYMATEYPAIGKMIKELKLSLN